ncbi:MAG TPA: tripartite tricarboxylate transporter substrate binding protein [Ramlibacter sp.]|nr:tripartite tricarboxylate transporter substrate binding protein [Ramlibacter sp.]
MKYLRALFVVLLAAASSVGAQEAFPKGPVKMIVGYAPGGGTDIIARILAPALSEELGQSVYVDNRPGASGTIGAQALVKSPPDGHTLMMGVVSLNAVQPSLNPNLPYDTRRDLVPVSLTASVPHFIAVHPSVPVKNLQELVAYAKANPTAISFPSAGSGTTPHLAGELFKRLTGTQMLHVPYKSTGASLPDLLAGTHKVSFDTYPSVAALVKSGKLRALAVAADARLADFPDVPTAAEAGVPFRMSTWYGVFAPKGTPKAIVSTLHAKTQSALARPAIRSALKEAGADNSVTRTPEEFEKFVQADMDRYAAVVKEANIKLD